MVQISIVNFIRKYWFIFALVVIYIVISMFNIIPRSLNVFKKQKLLIKETPVLVKEVKEIGELTTSEFYGEVYADLNEVFEKLIVDKNDSLERNRLAFYEKYKGLESFIEKSENFRVNELIYESQSKKYNNYLTDFIKKTEEYKAQEKEIKISLNSAKDKKEKRTLNKRLDKLSSKYKDDKENLRKIKGNFRDAEKVFRKQKNKFWESKKERNLVYIARGWVKAGIKFTDLNENDIIIDDDDTSSIHIVINNPVILDADINPWFIYTKKKKIQGYELFISKTGSLQSKDNFTDDEITAVKMMCKTRLREEAIKKGLLEKAKNSAITTLENFFHLVGFEKVTIRFKNSELTTEK